MIIYVIDTSALVKYVVEENHSATVRRIVAHHQAGAVQLIAPEFLLAECANVLWKYVMRNDLALADAVSALRTLHSLNILIVPQAELLEDALAFAGETRIAVYDALFCVLARREDAELITADIPLVNRLAGTGIRAITLSGWA